MVLGKGLANGSVGHVTDFIYDPEINSENNNDHLPLCILVNFDNFTGSGLYENSIPNTPLSSSFKKSEVNCTREQFGIANSHWISHMLSAFIVVEELLWTKLFYII